MLDYLVSVFRDTLKNSTCGQYSVIDMVLVNPCFANESLFSQFNLTCVYTVNTTGDIFRL